MYLTNVDKLKPLPTHRKQLLILYCLKVYCEGFVLLNSISGLAIVKEKHENKNCGRSNQNLDQ
jgi:hypothetical protein